MMDRHCHTRAIAFIAILAMMLPAIVPRGYMPRVDPHSGAISIVFCADMAPMRQEHASGHHDHHGMQAGQQDHLAVAGELCPFGVASTPLAISIDSLASIVTALPPLNIPRPDTPAVQHYLGPPFPARGPPLPI